MPSILIEKRYKIVRHSLLFVLTAILALNFVNQVSLSNIDNYRLIVGFFVYVILFGGAFYLNINVLAPQFLIRNKWSIYFVSLILLILVLIPCILLMQHFWYKFEIPYYFENYEMKFGILNISSGLIMFFLLFAGITTLLLFKYSIINDKRADELESATLELELKALKNQINPHFLFNMLNNANMLIKKNPNAASDVLFTLEYLLRYQMNESSKNNVDLDSEINFLNDFLNLEKIRRDNFEYSITTKGDIEKMRIPPMLFIPFVENAVKYSNDAENPSYIHILFSVIGRSLKFECVNSKSLNSGIKNNVGGLGLNNIKRRLDLLFQNRSRLSIQETDNEYIVKLVLVL